MIEPCGEHSGLCENVKNLRAVDDAQWVAIKGIGEKFDKFKDSISNRINVALVAIALNLLYEMIKRLK